MEGNNKIRKGINILKLIDIITAMTAWVIFWFHRHQVIQEKYPEIFTYNKFLFRDYLITLLFIPFFWYAIYYLSGTYFNVYKKSRLQEAFRGFISSFIGVILIGLFVFANDTESFSYFFRITSWYFLVHYILLFISRNTYLSFIKRQLIKGKVQINTLIIGNNGKANDIFKEIKNNPRIIGYNIVGLVNSNEEELQKSQLIEGLPYLGEFSQLGSIIDKYKIEQAVVALDTSERKLIESILIHLSYKPIELKVMPELYDIISGMVRTSNVFDNVMLSISPELVPDWQKVVKRVLDVFVSLIGLIILSPLLLINLLGVKLSSPGPIFFFQERIGLNGKPFKIIKFRSMYSDSEKNGPALSKDDDPRITYWGRIMRKWRFDELPQFFNVLKGEMALVGPRPERKHFIDIICKTHPHYKYLHRVKPGITSWGMVKFGYAENIEEMIERMKYDLLYVENASLLLDFKIMIFTLIVLFQGRGK